MPCFVKQLGAVPVLLRERFNAGVSVPMPQQRDQHSIRWVVFSPDDPKGGDPNQWPRRLRVRERPPFNPEENHA